MFPVDGLNLPDEGFAWKDRLFLTNNKRRTPNLALAAVAVNRKGERQDDVEQAYHTLMIFLTCYQLYNQYQVVARRGWDHQTVKVDGPDSLRRFVDEQSLSREYNAVMQNLKEDVVMSNIQKALPAFEIVMAAADAGKTANLQTALIMFYRSRNTMESIEDFVGIVTVLEALFSNDNTEITYKVALRTALAIKDSMDNTRANFDLVKEIYKKRSQLVHGSLLPVRYRKELIPLKMRAENYAGLSLKKYIEWVGQGKSRDDIIDMLDDMALGKSQRK